jgi:hypothetical protein
VSLSVSSGDIVRDAIGLIVGVEEGVMLSVSIGGASVGEPHVGATKMLWLFIMQFNVPKVAPAFPGKSNRSK